MIRGKPHGIFWMGYWEEITWGKWMGLGILLSLLLCPFWDLYYHILYGRCMASYVLYFWNIITLLPSWKALLLLLFLPDLIVIPLLFSVVFLP